MTILALIRHGPTDWNAEKRIQGRTDRPLGPAGGVIVAGWAIPPALDGFRWVSSPLRRAAETAAILTGRVVKTDPRLVEMNFGDWEGERLAELRADLGEAMWENEARGLDFQPPGGESPRAVMARVSGFWTAVARSETDTAAVCHNGVIRACYAFATGWNMTDRQPDPLRNSHAQLFDCGGDGSLTVRELNLPLNRVET